MEVALLHAGSQGSLHAASHHSEGSSTPPHRLPAFCPDKAKPEIAAPFPENKTLYHPGNKVLTRVAFCIKHQQHLPARTRECRAQSTRSAAETFVHFRAKGGVRLPLGDQLIKSCLIVPVGSVLYRHDPHV